MKTPVDPDPPLSEGVPLPRTRHLGLRVSGTTLEDRLERTVKIYVGTKIKKKGRPP